MGVVVVGGVARSCFQFETLALIPWINSCRWERSLRLVEPSGSSNANTREERSPVLYEEGGLTQLGF